MNNKKIFIIIGAIIAVIVTIIAVILVFNKKESITYNILFETNGGSLVKEQIVNKGEQAKKPTDPKKEGYIFIEWLINGKTYDFSLPVNSDIVLTAKWEEKLKDVETFVVKFNSDGGTTIPNQIIKKGDKIEKPTDPKKEGYLFKGWMLNTDDYNFDTIIENDLELKAKWEKVENTKKPSNNSSNNTSNNNSKSNNNQSTETQKNEIKLPTPKTTSSFAGLGPEVIANYLTVTNIDMADGIELYKSTTGNNYQLEKTITTTELSQQNNKIEIQAYLGEHNYYKVRAYKTINNKIVYSNYSSIEEVTGPTLSTPEITSSFAGLGPEVMANYLTVTNIDMADGIELYKSTTGSNYQLEKTITTTELSQQNNKIEIQAYLGEHNYYKVRAYKTINNKKVYSNYSGIVEVIGPTLSTPEITSSFAGLGPEVMANYLTVTNIDMADGIELYKSTTGSNYQLEKTITTTELSQQNNKIEIEAYLGEHNYYKVRAYKIINNKKVYSNYSSIVEVIGPVD